MSLLLRCAAFLGWSIVGFLLIYGGLYAFTPWGVTLLLLATAVALGVAQARWRPRLEVLGVLSGLGAFALLVGSYAGDEWLVAGAALVVTSLGAYVVLRGRLPPRAL